MVGPVATQDTEGGFVIGDVLMVELLCLEDVIVKLETADGAVLEVNTTYTVVFPQTLHFNRRLA